MQKSLIVWRCPSKKSKDNTNELNDYLKEGWKVISNNPMGGSSYGYAGHKSDDYGQYMLFCSLVILEKN